MYRIIASHSNTEKVALYGNMSGLVGENVVEKNEFRRK